MLSLHYWLIQLANNNERNAIVISRGSVFKTFTILNILKLGIIEPELSSDDKLKGEEISKMLFAMIRQLEKKS